MSSDFGFYYVKSYSGLMVVSRLTENRWNLAVNLAVMPFTFDFPYRINPDYKTPVAYFCMEYAIHQPLKTYAGGFGFLAGSHMRSAYTLGQNMVGIGILWKYGYYDQGRKSDQAMEVVFREKAYRLLVDTGIKFTIRISGHPVISLQPSTVIDWQGNIMNASMLGLSNNKSIFL